MINTYPEIRGGENYLFTVGKDLAAGKTNNFFIKPNEVDVLTGQKYKYYPVKLTVGFDEINCDGNVTSIDTEWWRVLIAVNGSPILKTAEKWGNVITSKLDIFYFIAGLGDAIQWSMVNGTIRDLLGFNKLPLFATTPIKDSTGTIIVPAGGVIPYTEEQQNEPPTFDYNKQDLVKVP